MKEALWWGAVGVLVLQSLGLKVNAKEKDIYGCILNATIMICLTIALTR